MSERFDQLNAKHRDLRERGAVQRAHLAQTAEEIEGQLGKVDRGVSVVRRVARNPVLIVAGIAIVTLVGPRRLLSFASRALVFYSTARRVAGTIREHRRIREAKAIADDLE
jgi:hypothetical protein